MTESEIADATVPSRLGRFLFASSLAALAYLNLTNLDGRIAYADAKGVPMADTLVPAASGLLFGGSLGIGAWKLPKLSAGGVAAFFIGVTTIMHDFWAVDEQSRSDELTSFLQNIALLGAAIAFFRRAQ